MELVYKIPPHLEGHIGNIETETLQKVITLVFEYAIQHRMLDYPKMHIENQVDDILNAVLEDKAMRTMEMSNITKLLLDINSKVSRLQTMGSIAKDFDNSLMGASTSGGEYSSKSTFKIEDEELNEEVNAVKELENEIDDEEDEDDFIGDICK